MSFLNYEDLSIICLDHTTKCNLKCPGCSRISKDGKGLNPNLEMTEISIDDYKRVFPKDVCKQLDLITYCGTNGDLIAASNVLECMSYLRNQNSNLKINIHTNGSLRSESWWVELSKILGPSSCVIFAIDGTTQETHGKYRINSDLQKVLTNAEAYISAGGTTRWDFIDFGYNSYQIEDAKKMAKDMGFELFVVKKSRALGNLDITRNFESNVYDGDNEKFKEILDKYGSFKNYMNSTTIECIRKGTGEIYIDHELRVWPCCWVGGPFFVDADYNLQKNALLNLLEKYGHDFNSLKDKSIEEVLEHRWFKYDMEESWNNDYDHPDNPKMTHCVKMCGEAYKAPTTDSCNRTVTKLKD